MDEWNWVILTFAIVMLGAGFVQSCLGFGYAVVALAILPYFMDIRVANLALSLSIVVPTIVGAWEYRDHIEWRALSWSVGGAVALLPIGLLTFSYLPVEALARSTGLLILTIALLELRSRQGRSPKHFSRSVSASMGAISGFLAGAIGIGGPPIALYAVRQSWSPIRLKAFLLSFLVQLSLLKAIGILAIGWMDRTVALYTTIAIPCATVGTHLGIAASRRIDARHFRQAVLVILILASAGLTLRGPMIQGESEAAESEGSTTSSIVVQFNGPP